jgi:hypothetical protein
LGVLVIHTVRTAVPGLWTGLRDHVRVWCGMPGHFFEGCMDEGQDYEKLYRDLKYKYDGLKMGMIFAVIGFLVLMCGR